MKALISLSLKDTFIDNGILKTGLQDGVYRKKIKSNIENIYCKTSPKGDLKSYHEFLDFPESTHLRLSLSIPGGYDAERFLLSSLKEIEKNPSVDIILESFCTSDAEIQQDFFSHDWKGFSRST